MQIQIEETRKEIKKHGEYAFPVNVSVERIQAYEHGIFLWHWHPEIELTLVLSGEMEYRVNDQVFTIQEGDGMFVNSNTPHSGIQIKGRTCSYLTITFHPRFLYGYESSEIQTKYVNFITEARGWGALRMDPSIRWQEEILDGMRDIYRISEEKCVDYELQVHIWLMQIWQKLYRYYREQPRKIGNEQSKNMQRLQQMIQYLQEHSSQNIGLEDLSDYINICKSECCRFFKRYMNMTIMEYLLFLRIQNSLPLLEQGESVTRTANLVGFSSAAYYGQIFRRYMKMTPREYRRNKGSSKTYII